MPRTGRETFNRKRLPNSMEVTWAVTENHIYVRFVHIPWSVGKERDPQENHIVNKYPFCMI